LVVVTDTFVVDEAKGHGQMEGEEDYVVNIEKFGNIVKWFGPLQTPFNDVNIIQKIRGLMTEA
jgi:hypothetical protein